MALSDHVETPSQVLARQIIERLVKEKLMSADAASKIQSKLADGTVRGEDWQLPIELGDDKETIQ